MARIYINCQVVASNQKTGEREPPITILGKGRRIAASAVEMGIVHSPDKPLKSGARVWIECDEPLCRSVKP
jgi:hypothetical protein